MKKIYNFLKGGLFISAFLATSSAFSAFADDVDYAYFTLDPDNSAEYFELANQIKLTFPNINLINNASGFVDVKSDNGYQSGAREYKISMSDKEDNVIFINIPKPITTAGVYTFTIPGSTIDVDDIDAYLPAISFQYKVIDGYTPPEAEDISVSVDPAEGEYDAINEWKVTFNDITSVTVSSNASQKDYPQLYNVNADGTIGSLAYPCMTVYAGAIEEGVEGAVAMDGNVLSIKTYVSEVNIPGKYALVIPAGKIFLDDVAFKNDIVFYYTVKEKVVEKFDYTWSLSPDPEDGPVVRPKEFSVIFDGVSEVKNDEFASVGPRLYYVKDGVRQASYIHITPITCKDNTVTMSVYADTPVSESGYYDLVIPANYLTVTSEDGTVTMNVPAIEARYNILVETVYQGTIVCRPVEDENLNVFRITFNPVNESVVTGKGAVNLLDEEYEVIAVGEVTIEDNVAFVNFTLDEELQSGNYIIEVEADAFVIDGARNNAQFFSFDYVGIDALSADSSVEVYNMQGIKMSGELHPGIYVIIKDGKAVKTKIR